MPIYEYKCADCGNVDEHLMRVSDPAPAGCTKCGGSVSKLLSQTSFALKGEGWYVTDYKPKPKGAEGAGKEAGGAEAATTAGDAPAAGKEAPVTGGAPATGSGAAPAAGAASASGTSGSSGSTPKTGTDA